MRGGIHVQLGKGSGLWSMQWGRPGQGPGQERTWGSPKAEEVRVDRVEEKGRERSRGDSRVQRIEVRVKDSTDIDFF